MREPWTTERRINFTIDFAEDRLYGYSTDVFKPGDWLNLRDDLNMLLGKIVVIGTRFPIDQLGFVPLPTDSSDEISETELRLLQKEMRDVLRAVAGYRLRTSGEYSVVSLGREHPDISISLKYTITPNLRRSRSLLAAKGKFRDCVLAVLMNLLRADIKSILLCPECGRVFYRHRKQVFCNVTCTNRAMAKRFRAKQLEKAQQSKTKKGSSHGRKRSAKR